MGMINVCPKNKKTFTEDFLCDRCSRDATYGVFSITLVLLYSTSVCLFHTYF